MRAVRRLRRSDEKSEFTFDASAAALTYRKCFFSCLSLSLSSSYSISSLVIIFKVTMTGMSIHLTYLTEFYNTTFQKMLKQRNINMYSTYSNQKAYICERFNRTLKQRMWKQFSLRGSYKWIDILQMLISDYNNSMHRTIKMTPNEVNVHNERMLLDTIYNTKIKVDIRKPKFRIGDLVRLTKYKHIFQNGYTPNWTTEVFKVKIVQKTNPTTYLLTDLEGNDIKGSVYSEELLLAKVPDVYLVEKIIRKKGDMCYVKWLGFDDTHNSWIKEEELI